MEINNIWTHAVLLKEKLLALKVNAKTDQSLKNIAIANLAVTLIVLQEIRCQEEEVSDE